MSDRDSDRTSVQFGKNPGCWPQKCLARGLSLCRGPACVAWARSVDHVCARCTACVGHAERFIFCFHKELEIVF